MQSFSWFSRTTQYIVEAIIRIFRPDHDQYPAIGMFAFHGEMPAANQSNWPEPLACPLACPLK